MARTRWTRWGGFVVVSAFLWCNGRDAAADPPGKGVLPVHVVAIRSDTSYDQADALTAAIRSRVRALKGYSLGDGDFALEVLMLGLRCGDNADDACQAKMANQIHADRYVWGTVEHAPANKQVIAELHLWVRGQPPSSTRLTYSDNLTVPGDESLRRLVDDALKKLLGSSGGTQEKTVMAAPPRLLPAPASVTPVAVAAASAAAPVDMSAPVSSSVGARRIIGWSGVGLGSFFFAAGLYSLVRVHDVATNDRYSLYLSGFHSNVNACDQARGKVSVMTPSAATPTEMRDLCSELSTFETLEIVFFGAAAISAGTGIFLLATDSSARPTAAAASPPPRVQVTAFPGHGGGDVRLRVLF